MRLADVLKPGMKGAFYGRHSTDKQDLISQTKSVQDLVKKYKCEIIEDYLDEAVSATKKPMEQRKYLQKLITDASEKKFDFIVVYKSDRLARNPHEHSIIRALMHDFDMPVVISSTEDTYEKKDDLLAQLMLDGFSKYEADNIRIRTYDGKIAKAATGTWLGGKEPYGYRYDKKTKTVETVPSELSIVKEMFELYKKNYGFQSIANHLNTAEEQTWTKKRIKDIIINPVYAGYISWGKRTNGVLNEKSLWIEAPTDLFPPIISKEEWDICYQLYEKRSSKQISPKYYNTSYLLYDIIQCKHCKTKLQTKDQRTERKGKVYGERIYRCTSCKLRCPVESIHTDIVNDILNEVRLKDVESIYEGVKVLLENEVNELTKQIDDLNEERDRYVVEADRVKDELKNLMNAKRDVRLIKSLYKYYLEVQRKKNNVKQHINEKEKQIKIKEDAKYNRKAWSNILENIMRDQEFIDDMDIRRLFIPLVEYVTIDKDLKVEYKLRIDNTKRKLSKQMQFLY